MQFEDSEATRATEEIMQLFSRFNNNCVTELSTGEYNTVFSHTHEVLTRLCKRLDGKNKLNISIKKAIQTAQYQKFNKR